MAQHDYVIDNSTGANVRADINSVLQAIASNNSGSSAPSTTFALQFYADTTNNILKLRNAANDGFINLFTLAGGVDVDAASNFNEDVTFQGANHTIVFDKSEDALKFADNAIAKFGGSSDLQIFNNGSTTSFIQETQANLFLSIAGGSNQLQLNKGTSENMAVFVGDGQVILYHDNSERLETTASGVNFGGNLTSSSNTTFTISAGGTGTAGHISLKCGSEDAFLATPEGSVELYHDNEKKFETTSDGVMTTGRHQFANDSGTSAGFTHCLVSGTISDGGTFTAQTHNVHAGGLVTITANRRPSGSNNKNISIFPIVINSTSNATLGTALSSMSGSSGSSFSVAGTSQGVIVTNTSGLDQRVVVRFDIAA